MCSRRQSLGTLAGGGAWLTVGLPALAPSASGARTEPSHWSAWDAFRARFVSDDGRVIDRSTPRLQTTSEGQAYALFFALVANDRPGFERLLRWTQDNLCAGDLGAHLPAWLWGQRADTQWGVLDGNSASDADLWLAYALGEAGRLWDHAPYLALSQRVAARIVREETATLPGLGLCLLPGPQGFALPGQRWRLNPSYSPLQLVRGLRLQTGEPVWKSLEQTGAQVLLQSAPRGYVPDWTVFDARRGFEPDAGGPSQRHGGYNAIRAYLWVGMLHPQTPGRQALLSALTPMARYVRAKGSPPEYIDIVSAEANGAGPAGFCAALLPLLSALADQASLRRLQTRLLSDGPGVDDYYGRALTLFGSGWIEAVYRFTAHGQLQPRWAP